MADKIESLEENNFERRLTRSAAKSAKKGVPSKIKPKNAKESNRSTSTKKTPKKPTKPIKRRILEENSDGESNSDRVSDDADEDFIPEDISDDDDEEELCNDEEEEEDYEDEERLITPLALISDTNVTGQDVFGFQTPGRKTGSLAQAASEASHVKKNKTPTSSKKYTKIADKRNTTDRKRNQEKQVQEEKPMQNKKPKKSSTSAVKANGSYGRRGRPPILLQSSNESDGESDAAVSSDNESDTGSGPSATPVTKKSTKSDAGVSEDMTMVQIMSSTMKVSKALSTVGKKTPKIDKKSMVEEYFSVHHDTKCVTSDRTLASLATPLMDHDEVSKHLHQVRATHPMESLHFYQEYRKYFPKWMFQIRHGFNLLLYGLGSKRVLIDQFRSSMLQGYTQLVVNGFFPSITIKNILNTITEDVLEHDGAFKSVIDQTSFIQETFRKGKGPGELYLIIHNIDGTMLRSKKAQTVLSLLAEIPFIHIIASIDHINAPLVWDQCMCSRFKFLWYDVTTFEPYSEETSYENSLLVQQSGSLALSSMNHVMRSLTSNGQGIFLLIVNYQLQEKDNSTYIGYNIYDLYNKCREKFLVNSEQTLHAQLTEFRDHKLIRSKKHGKSSMSELGLRPFVCFICDVEEKVVSEDWTCGTDGVEHLMIPLDAATLKQFLEEQQTPNS